MVDSKKSSSKQASGSQSSDRKIGSKKAGGKKTVTRKVRHKSDRASSAAPVPAAAADNTSPYIKSPYTESDQAPSERVAAPPDQPATDHSARTRISSLTWLSLLLAVLACAAIGLLLVNKGRDYFLLPDASEVAAANLVNNSQLANHAQLTEIANTQAQQQQRLDQLRNAVDKLQSGSAGQDELQRRLDQLASTVQTGTSATNKADDEQSASINLLQGEQANQSRRINEVAATLAQLQARQSDNEAEMQRQFNALRLQQRLDEISSILRAGRQQLLLNSNQQAALDAYDLAQQALQELPTTGELIPESQINALRQALASERAQLASVEVTDSNMLIAELNGLADAVQDWPLQNDQSSQHNDAAVASDSAGDDAAEAGLWQQLRGNLGHLVTVRNTEKPQLSIDEQLKLKRHLQLQLRTSALLLLQQRDAAWHNSLDSIEQFIQQWFATDNRGVAAARKRLRELEQINVNPSWPQADQAAQLLAEMQVSASKLRR